ncbi:rhomboid family intramembrane serine protease [Geochorda subterranea]|uniref:Rhomboid family intramembrane serine protease n=1 Tax=Geochorda subterranea TaxID=3109564 RepID=A0ABZ1BMG9_9FIRM|nr:rhomboid family intramembrane serine protease [Limnochorda sp. LNt]WRP14022.1 rhomboid family intramembrane serine protease [Limnochorda sp. LNt]
MTIIPLRDNVPTRRYPYVNKVLVAINLLVFLYEVVLGREAGLFIYRWGLVPARLWGAGGGLEMGALWALPGLPPAWLTLVTSMFLHAGWLHVGSNMLYLWIFGDNVEDRLGHLRYLVFYLLGGVGAGLLQSIFSAGASVPTIGASGAVAAVLGAYWLLFPWAKVSTLVPVFFFLTIAEIPAVVFLLLWFLIQLYNGALAITASPTLVGGVAWWAHIGGFVVGLLLVRWWGIRRQPPVWW